VTLGYALALHR